MLWAVEQFEEPNEMEKEHILLWPSSFISGNMALENFLYRTLYKMHIWTHFGSIFKNNIEELDTT